MTNLKENKKVRRRFTFEELKVEVGAILTFTKNEKITCQVLEKQRVLFNGIKCRISRAAEIVLEEEGYEWKSVRGYKYWQYNGKTLMQLSEELKLKEKNTNINSE